MNGDNDVFRRVEQKYLLDPCQREALEEEMAQHIKPDSYGLQTIASVYYDSPDFALIRQSLDKPVYKEKLRLRSYGRAEPDSGVYVEIKKKYKGVVSKRRVQMRLREAELFLRTGLIRCPVSQVHREIDYFRQIHRVEPRAYIAYERAAWAGAKEGGLRVTFDIAIRGRDMDLSLDGPLEGALILPEGLVLMEVKTLGAMPLWLASTLSELAVYPASFSKYGSWDQQRLAREGLKQGGFIHVA